MYIYTLSLTPALYVCGWFTPMPGSLTTTTHLVRIVQDVGLGRGTALDGCGTSRPSHRDSFPKPSTTLASRYTY